MAATNPSQNNGENTQSNSNEQNATLQVTFHVLPDVGDTDAQMQDGTDGNEESTHCFACSFEGLDPLFTGTDPIWARAELVAQTFREAADRDIAGRENDAIGSAENENFTESAEEIAQAQSEFAAHVAFVFASYGVNTDP